MAKEASLLAISQYAKTSDRLSARLSIHSWSTGASWFPWVAARVPVSGEVLEVGAGTGELWRHVSAGADLRLTLSDFSASMCSDLERVTVSGAAAVSVVQADATALPFGAGSFDGLVANQMLYHVDDPDAALAEFSRVLRPGGALRVALNGMTHLDALLAVGEAVGRPSMMRHHAKISADNAAAILGRHFADVRSERCPGNFEVTDVEPVVRYLHSVGAEDLAPDQAQRARDLVDAKIREEGAFRVTKNMVLFSARKP